MFSGHVIWYPVNNCQGFSIATCLINARQIGLTLTKALINHLESQILHCNTSTTRVTTCPPPQRTFLPVSKNNCHPYHLTKHPLTKWHLHTRKHSTIVDTTTLYSATQLKQANGKTDNATTSSGTTLLLQYCLKISEPKNALQTSHKLVCVLF